MGYIDYLDEKTLKEGAKRGSRKAYAPVDMWKKVEDNFTEPIIGAARGVAENVVNSQIVKSANPTGWIGGIAPPAPIDTAAQINLQAGKGVEVGKPISSSNPNGIGPTVVSDAPALPAPDKTPIDQTEFSGGKGSGINYSLDAAGNVVAEAATAKPNPYDQQFKGMVDRLDSLNKMVLPAKSGYIGDTIEQNFELFNEMKNIKDILPQIRAMTTEGQGIPAHQIVNAKPLDPTTRAMNEAHTELAKAQLGQYTPKPELIEKKAVMDIHEGRAKHREKLYEANPNMDPEVVDRLVLKARPMPEKSRRTVQDKDWKDMIEITLIDGTVLPPVGVKSGKPQIEKPGGVGVPTVVPTTANPTPKGISAKKGGFMYSAQ